MNVSHAGNDGVQVNSIWEVGMLWGLKRCRQKPLACLCLLPVPVVSVFGRADGSTTAGSSSADGTPHAFHGALDSRRCGLTEATPPINAL
jgi:hypothetical protein